MAHARVGFIAATLLFAPSAAAQVPSPPTAPAEPFTDVPGRTELTGVMIARPLQPEDARRYGLSGAEVAARRSAAIAALLEFSVVEHVPETDETLIEVPQGTENEVAAALMAHGDFQYVEPDWRVYPAACPNDPGYANQWHHIAIRLNSCAAWDLSTGSSSVVVAICDTGVRKTHQDLALHRVEGYNAVDRVWESAGGAIGDLVGHGTAATGCAAANGDNGLGVCGMGWKLGHRMMRVTNQASGNSTVSILTHAARKAADAGDRVANVSFTGVTSASVNTTGGYLRSKGALLVWAAGNDGKNLAGNREDDVIIVGATTASDSKATFSNYGPLVDLMAPGIGILTTDFTSDSSYGTFNGTSYACPLVSGLCAMILSAEPSLTPAQVEAVLRAGCDDLGPVGVDDTYGYGRIDALGSIGRVKRCQAPKVYCQSAPNSFGPVASISWFGSDGIGDGDFSLSVTGSVPGQFGHFFYGPGSQTTSVGNGYLCVSGKIFRLPVAQADAAGTAAYRLDFAALPPGGQMAPGETWNFQWWYRDPGIGATFNFSDALRVSWCR